MNKNDKFHTGIELNDSELDSVAGGSGNQCTVGRNCKICGTHVYVSMPYDAEAGYSKTVQCPGCGASYKATFNGGGFGIQPA